MNGWQVGDLKISCVVEFKSRRSIAPAAGYIRTDQATYRFDPSLIG